MNIGMKKMSTLIIVLSLISGTMIAQESTKKILLTTEHKQDIEYKDLHLNTLLQVYDENSSAQLVGDIYLRVNNSDKTIADFYIENDQPEKVYDTQIYKNYFLTFMIENNNNYLIIEQANFGKPFALSSNGSATIGTKDDLVAIEIIDVIHEQGYDAPPDDPNRKSFDNVRYTLKINVRGVTKNFSFYSSEIKGNYAIDLGSHSIVILSDTYKYATSLIEMVINKIEEK
tara:strand:+ start:74543 stop:75229 length:687 start_codon:yes stop_codon:yes gene_type:complete